jgi:hypothetical protein
MRQQFSWLRPRSEGCFAVEIRRVLRGPNTPRSLRSGTYIVETCGPEDFESYEPSSALFLDFANMPLTAEGALEFASEHGRLGGTVETSVGQRSAEHLDDWFHHSRRIRELWETCTLAASGGEKAEKLYASIADQITPEIQLAKPAMVCEPDSPRPRVRIVPSSLLTAMYLQLAAAVDENKQFQKCRHCGGHFELSPGVNRADKIFCSESCRVMEYRRRKDQPRPKQPRELSLRERRALKNQQKKG